MHLLPGESAVVHFTAQFHRPGPHAAAASVNGLSGGGRASTSTIAWSSAAVDPLGNAQVPAGTYRVSVDVGSGATGADKSA